MSEEKKPAESPEGIQAGPPASQRGEPQSKGLGGEVKVPAKFKDLVKKIEEMSTLDLAELVKVLEEKFGVSSVVAMAAAPTAVGAPTSVGEEKTSFTVELKNAGSQKIQVIKVVREITGKGLKEAKDFVEGAPQVVKENVKKEEAEEIKDKLEKAGATVELK